jgi:hypothetical protein
VEPGAINVNDAWKVCGHCPRQLTQRRQAFLTQQLGLSRSKLRGAILNPLFQFVPHPGQAFLNQFSIRNVLH